MNGGRRGIKINREKSMKVRLERAMLEEVNYSWGSEKKDAGKKR